MNLTLSFRSRPILWSLSLIAAVLVALSAAGTAIRHYTSYTTLKGTIPLFYLGNEANVPTFFSSFLLLVAATSLLVLAIARHRNHQRHRLAWFGLAAVFLLLAVDEASQIHEWTANIVRPLVGNQGIFTYAWVAVGLAFVAACGLAFFRLWWDLPPRQRLIFAVAACFYVGGALGLEMVESRRDAAFGHDFVYEVLVNCEEAMEMTGVLILLSGVFSLLTETLRGVNIRFSPADRLPSPATASAAPAPEPPPAGILPATAAIGPRLDLSR